jgi:hypothetical protein
MLRVIFAFQGHAHVNSCAYAHKLTGTHTHTYFLRSLC